MSDQNLTVSLSHFPCGDAENSTDWSSWLSHGSSNVTVKYPSRKYSVEYEPTGRSPGSVPPYRHSGTQPRILACWCSPPPLAPPPQVLSARATRAINTMRFAIRERTLLPSRAAAGCTTGSPRLLGAHLLRDAVLGLCPLLGGSVPRLCGMAHPPKVVSLLLLGVASA